MFKAYVNGVLFYDDSSSQENLKVLSPVLDVEESSAGSFKFTVPPTNIKYGAFVKVTSVVTIKKLNSNNVYWEGRVVDISEDFWKCQTVTCEGSLAYLNDTIQPNASYSKKTPKEFVEILLAAHNAKVNNNKKILLGSVSISDTTKVDRYTNFETTFDLIKKQVETSGGHVSIRYASGNRYLDWSDTYSSSTTQRIEFGENLLDYSSNMSIDDFCTVLIPQGAKLEDTEGDFDEYLDVKSVNGGSIYVSLTAGDYQTPPSVLPIDAFGRLELVKRWEDITQPTNLLLRAKRYLLDQQFDKMRLEISAFDLKYADASYEEIELLDKVQVVSAPHGLNKAFPVTKMSIPLDTPEDTKFTLGGEVNRDSTLTGVTRSSSSSLSDKIDEKPSEAKITRKYKEDISYEIEKHTKGYVNIITNDSGSQEFVISDTPNYLTASRIWRWTLNGLAFSKNGYNQGPYEVALTADGQINANMISTGVLNADLIKAGILQDQNGGENFSLNLETGELHIKMVSDLNEKLIGIGTTNMILNTLNPVVTPAANRPRIRGQVRSTDFSAGTAETTDHGVTVISTGAVRPYIRFGASSITSEQAGLNGLMPGKTYTFSCDARWNLYIPGASGSGRTFVVRLVTNAANPDVFENTFTYSIPILPEQYGVDMIGRVEFTFTVPEIATKLYLWATGNIPTASAYQAGNFISLANIKLETGQVATGWSPAPEDMERYTQTLINISAEGIESRVAATYTTKEEFGGLQTRVGKAETAITQNSEQILLRATKEEAQNYASTAENAAITSAAADATSKANAAKTAAINAAAADATTKADKAKSDAIQAANAATDQKLVNYSTTTEMNSAINVKADAIEQSVAATYTTKAEFENLNVGAINYLLGTQKMKGWSKGAGATVDDTGEYAIATLNGSSSNWSAALTASPTRDISILDGSSFTFSMLYSSTTDAAFNVTLASTARAPGSASGSRTKYATFRSQTILSTDGAWKTWSYTVDNVTPEFMTAGSGDQNSWYITVYCRTQDAELKIQKLKFEKGNRATDWSPAPEDISQGAIDYTNSALTSYTTKTELESSLETTAEGILGTVSETYTTKTEFANLEIGGRNYLQFSNDPESWGWYTPTEYAVAKIFLYSNLVKEKKYTLTVYGQAPTRSDKTDCVYYACWGGANVNLGRIPMNNGRGVLTFTTPSSDHADTQNAWIQIYNTPPKGASGTVYTAEITKVKLEEGDKATDWTPAPEDVEHEFTVQKQAILDITSDEITAAVTKSEEGQPIVNLLPSVYWREAASSLPYTAGGVKWTLNADGSLTAQLADGATAATANSYFTLTGNTLTTSPPVLTVNPSKKHVFYGCPPGGSSTTYRMIVQKWTEDNPPTGAAGSTSYDYGSGVKLAAGFKWLYLYCAIGKNYAFPDGPVTFYPMLEVGQIAHGYVSSHNGSGTLTERVKSAEASISVQADQIASKVSTTDYNGNKIASLINQNATTIQINAQKIDLQGAVSFASFDTATKDALVTNTTTKNQYAQSTSATTAPTSGWVDTIPVYDATKKYIWTRVSTTKTYAGGKSETTTSTATVDKNLSSAIEAAASAQSTANSAVGTTKSTQQYYLSTSATSATGGSWADTVPTWAENKYVWTRMKTESTQKDGTALTPVYSTAVYDKNLTTALSTAASAQSTANSSLGSTQSSQQYYLSTSATSATGGTWLDTVPTWEADKYVWTRTKTGGVQKDGTIVPETYSAAVYDKNLTTALSTASSASTAAGTAQTTANGAVKSTSVKTQYYLSTSASSATGGSWVDTVPTWTENKYVWTRVATTTTPISGSASTTYTPSQNGTYDVNTTKALSDAASLAEGISAINLVPIVYNAEAAYGTKRTTNGITFEVLGNGQIKVTGTATANATFYIAGTGLTSAVPQITLDPTKAYTFSGCPAGGSAGTYCLRANFYAENSETSAVLRTDTGSGYTQAAQYYGASLYIRIENGYACPTDGLIFKPMFEVGKVKHNYVSSRSGVQGLSAKAIKATVSCYYRSRTHTPPNIYAGITISTTEYNKDDEWTYLLPQPSKGKYFYTCEQYMYADGSVSFSTVREMTNLSVTSAWCSANDRTLIDGAAIFTGSVTADKIKANSITANQLDINQIFSQSITATNFKLRGGTVNINASGALNNDISITYNNIVTGMCAYGFAVMPVIGGVSSSDKACFEAYATQGSLGYGIEFITNYINTSGNILGTVQLDPGRWANGYKTIVSDQGMIIYNSSGTKVASYTANWDKLEFVPSEAYGGVETLTFGNGSNIGVHKYGKTGILEVQLNITGGTFNAGVYYVIEFAIPPTFKPYKSMNHIVASGKGCPVLVTYGLVEGVLKVRLYRYTGTTWSNGWIRAFLPIIFDDSVV